MNLNQAASHALGVERRDDLFGVGALLLGVGQQLQQRRLVRDQCAHPSGMPGDQRQPGHRAAAGSEDISGLGAQRIQQRGHIVGAQLRGGVLLGSSIELAAIPRGS